MTTQALSVAVSSSGLTKLFNALVVSGSAFAQGLVNQSLGSPDVYVGGIQNTSINNYSVQLTSGTITTASATLSSAAQTAAGSNQFQLTFDVTLQAAFQDWAEAGNIMTYPSPGPPYNQPFGPTDCGQWSFTANGIPLNATVEIGETSDGWAITFVSATSTTPSSGIVFGLPPKSILNSPAFQPSCGAATIAQQLDPALTGNINYAPAIQAAINPLLQFLTESGKLTSDITFQWTPNTFQFPETSAGLQAGVTGDVLYDGNAFQYGSTPPNVGLPTIVETSDVQFFAADALFSALYWAWYENDGLRLTITQDMLSDPQYLNTDYYQNSIPGLYQQYPNAAMQIVVAPQSAPTIAFITGYEVPPPYLITPAVLLSLQTQGLPADDVENLQGWVGKPFQTLDEFEQAVQGSLGPDYAQWGQTVITAATTGMVGLGRQLPPDVYNDLLGMIGQQYFSQAAFQGALAGAMGASDAAQYQTQIETVAAIVFAQLTHAPTCTYQVMTGQDSAVTAFVIQVTETDELTNFQLAVSGTSQTVQCDVQINQNPIYAPNATLVSSNVGDVNPSDFALLWQYDLGPVYGAILQEVAATGVPVPWIEGYTLQQSTVVLQPGYADVTANVVIPAS